MLTRIIMIWKINIILIESDSATTDESNGLFSVKSVLSIVLSRQELNAFLECRVETPALQATVSNQLHIDLQGNFSV